jgi:two-component system, OmpR family, phosphate regulon response regulator PhoB
MDGSILIVEDDPDIQELVAVNLRHAGFQTTCAQTVAHAEVLIARAMPDLMLLDWVLPDTLGVTFARRLRADPRTRKIPIIMLSVRTRESDRVTGLEAGADDYITKPFYPRELIARIKAVLRRCAPHVTDDVVEIAGLRCDPVECRVSAKGRDLDIAGLAFRLLHFLMTHPGKIYRRAQLLNEVWGNDACVEERTVDVHIRMLRHALARTGHTALLETVRGAGYRFAYDASVAHRGLAERALVNATRVRS